MPTCIAFYNAYAFTYLNLLKYVNGFTTVHDCIFILLHVVTVDYNKTLHFHKMARTIQNRKNYLLYCISAYNAHCQVLVDVYFSLLSVKDTWFLETRTDVPMFSRSITCSDTVPEIHLKGTMSYSNLASSQCKIIQTYHWT